MSGTQTPTEVELEEDLEGLTLDDHQRVTQQDREREIIQGGGDDDELEQFRREWRDEVIKQRARAVDAGGVKWKTVPGPGPGLAVPSSQQRSPVQDTRSPAPPAPSLSPQQHEHARYRDRDRSPTKVKAPSSFSTSRIYEATNTAGAGPSRSKVQPSAVQLYAQAVESEQSGQLNDALLLYRRAFKIDDDVDRLYQRSLPKHVPAAAEVQEAVSNTPTSTDIVSPAAPPDEPYSFQRHLQFQPDYQKAAQPSTSPSAAATTRRRSPLSTLFDKASVPPDEAQFMPANEDKPLPLASLPAELLEPIFSHLDLASLERFGLTCWRSRLLTARANVWKRRVQEIYRGPMVSGKAKGGGAERVTVTAVDLARRHAMEWRTTFIEEERVRMDGCYISVCHYVRPGAGDEWVAVTHMITYHRFLRFYPDGTVISFLTTDHPSNVVPLLRPSLRAKGLHFGRWRIEHAKVIITELLEPGTQSPKYEFEMTLSLKETQRGRWNKLDIDQYHSINLANDEILALSLKHQKPFYFSKVKSYHPAL